MAGLGRNQHAPRASKTPRQPVSTTLPPPADFDDDPLTRVMAQRPVPDLSTQQMTHGAIIHGTIQHADDQTRIR